MKMGRVCKELIALRHGGQNNEKAILKIGRIKDKIITEDLARNSRKSVTWSAVPDAPKLVYIGM